ncbi:MAG TPA: hybrid sensor histidine kinase/response regulator, partial [Burkholderiaceae bacterium]|nr:hybrid sensor histidine kinase/response regulator [Burkholderiaceae bacterium]
MDASQHTETMDDLSALAWVQEELRRSLEAAHKLLRRHLKEVEAASGSDVSAVDPAVLRNARAQLHQGVGALELVGLPTAASVLRAAEAAVQRCVGRSASLNIKAVEAIEHASFALLDYLQRMLGGKAVSPLALFPQYRAVQQLAGADRVHPADLWVMDWRWRELPADASSRARPFDADARGEVEQQMLTLMRGPSADAAQRMSTLFAELGAGARDAQTATLWGLAAAFFEAQAADLLAPDVYGKRVASRLLAQLRAVERGDVQPSDRLAQDLLFFCAQCRAPRDAAQAPRLWAVRSAYGLQHGAPVDYEAARLGRFDPAVIAQARKRVAGAKDAWSAVAGGELHRLSSLNEQFSLVGDSLQRLVPQGDTLAQALLDAGTRTVQSADAPPAPLAMEVATGLLYLEASLEDAEFDDPAQGARVQRLAARIAAVAQGSTPEPLESWMEELYRRVSDRQTMGSVVQELRGSLSEIEQQIDAYFRNPAERALLIPVPGQLQAMRGVLSVLGMDQASHAVLRMRDEVDVLANTEVDPARAAQTFDRLAGNLGALGFLIDMLSVQPQTAKSLFVFDAEQGTLSPVMGRQAKPSGFGALTLIVPTEAVEAAAPVPAAPALIEQAQSLAVAAASPEVPLETITLDLERLSQSALLSDQSVLAATVSTVQTALDKATDADSRHAVREELAQVMVDFVATASDASTLEPEIATLRATPVPPPPAAPVPPGATGLEEDDEMREV